MPDTTPTPITPLEGKTTIDDKMFFEPERLSYQSAVRIAQKIADQVSQEVNGELVVIAGTSLLADFANLQAVYLVLESLRRDYEAIARQAESLTKRTILVQPELESLALPEADNLAVAAASAAFAPATTLVSAALGLVSLFREDVEFRGIKTIIDPLSFELTLAAAVKAKKANKVFVPDLMAIPLAEAQAGSLRDRLEKVQNAKAQAWAAVGPMIIELVHLEAALDQAVKDKDQKRLDRLTAEVSRLSRDLKPLSDPLGRADQRLADLQNQWNQVEESSQLSLLARLLRAEAIHAKKPLYLHAKVVSSGGHHRVSRNLLRMIFLGDGLSFAGGAIARWALLENDGSVAKGGLFVERRSTDFLQPADS